METSQETHSKLKQVIKERISKPHLLEEEPVKNESDHNHNDTTRILMLFENRNDRCCRQPLGEFIR